MADKQATAYCEVCEQQRLFTKPGINNVLHLILTIVTVGLWGIVWIILAISNSGKKFRCTTCGWKMGVGAPERLKQGQESPPPSPPAVPEENRERDEKTAG